MNGECVCTVWALRIDAEPWLRERAITFTCPVHEAVTIDDRPIILRYAKRPKARRATLVKSPKLRPAHSPRPAFAPSAPTPHDSPLQPHRRA